MTTRRSLLGITVVGLCAVGADADAQARADGCRGSGAGGMSLASNVQVVFVFELAADSATFPVIFVGRAAAPGGFRPVRRSLHPPPLPTPERYLSGSTIGTLFMRYDARSHTAWVHTERVPLERANVILVDRADAVGGAPVVIDSTRADLAFLSFASDCRAPFTRRDWEDTLRARLSLVPEIRAFMATP